MRVVCEPSSQTATNAITHYKITIVIKRQENVSPATGAITTSNTIFAGDKKFERCRHNCYLFRCYLNFYDCCNPALHGSGLGAISIANSATIIPLFLSVWITLLLVTRSQLLCWWYLHARGRCSTAPKRQRKALLETSQCAQEVLQLLFQSFLLMLKICHTGNQNYTLKKWEKCSQKYCDYCSCYYYYKFGILFFVGSNSFYCACHTSDFLGCINNRFSVDETNQCIIHENKEKDLLLLPSKRGSFIKTQHGKVISAPWPNYAWEFDCESRAWYLLLNHERWWFLGVETCAGGGRGKTQQQHTQKEIPIHPTVKPCVTPGSAKEETRFGDKDHCCVSNAEQNERRTVVFPENLNTTARGTTERSGEKEGFLIVAPEIAACFGRRKCAFYICAHYCHRWRWCIDNPQISHDCAAPKFRNPGRHYYFIQIEGKTLTIKQCLEWNKLTNFIATPTTSIKGSNSNSVALSTSSFRLPLPYVSSLTFSTNYNQLVRELLPFPSRSSLFYFAAIAIIVPLLRLLLLSFVDLIREERSESKSNKSLFPGKKGTSKLKPLSVFVVESTALLLHSILLSETSSLSSSSSFHKRAAAAAPRFLKVAAKDRKVTSAFSGKYSIREAIEDNKKHVSRASETTSKITTMGFSVSTFLQKHSYACVFLYNTTLTLLREKACYYFLA